MNTLTNRNRKSPTDIDCTRSRPVSSNFRSRPASLSQSVGLVACRRRCRHELPPRGREIPVNGHGGSLRRLRQDTVSCGGAAGRSAVFPSAGSQPGTRVTPGRSAVTCRTSSSTNSFGRSIYASARPRLVLTAAARVAGWCWIATSDVDGLVA